MTEGESECVWGRVLQRHRTKFLPNFRTPGKKKSRRALSFPVVSVPAENCMGHTKYNNMYIYIFYIMACSETQPSWINPLIDYE